MQQYFENVINSLLLWGKMKKKNMQVNEDEIFISILMI